MTLDIPNAFVQTLIPQDSDKVMMKIRGPLVDILCEICPGVYDNFVIYEGKQNKSLIFEDAQSPLWNDSELQKLH